MSPTECNTAPSPDSSRTLCAADCRRSSVSTPCSCAWDCDSSATAVLYPRRASTSPASGHDRGVRISAVWATALPIQPRPQGEVGAQRLQRLPAHLTHPRLGHAQDTTNLPQCKPLAVV